MLRFRANLTRMPAGAIRTGPAVLPYQFLTSDVRFCLLSSVFCLLSGSAAIFCLLLWFPLKS
jgi:hypothetical protein